MRKRDTERREKEKKCVKGLGIKWNKIATHISGRKVTMQIERCRGPFPAAEMDGKKAFICSKEKRRNKKKRKGQGVECPLSILIELNFRNRKTVMVARWC